MSALAAFVRKELRVSARERRRPWVRVGSLLLLLAIFLLYWNLGERELDSGLGVLQLAERGRRLFWQVAVAQCLVVLTVGPVLAAGMVNTEVRQRTLGLLQAGGLGSTGIVLGKWLACFAHTALLALASLPLLLIAKALGGATGDQLRLAAWSALILAATGPALGLLFSSLFARYHTALIGTALCAAGLGIGPMFFRGGAELRFWLDPVYVLVNLESFVWRKASPIAAMLGCTAAHAALVAFCLIVVGLRLRILAHDAGGPPWTARLGAWIDERMDVDWSWNLSFGSGDRRAIDGLLALECAAGPTRSGRALGRGVVLMYVLLAVAYALVGGSLADKQTLAQFQCWLSGGIFLWITASAASMVARDVERGTLDPLLATPLSGRRVVWTKALAALRGSVPLLALAGMHGAFMAVTGFYGAHVLAGTLAATFGYAVLCCGVGVAASTAFRRSAPAALVALLALAALIAVPPLASDLLLPRFAAEYRSRLETAMGCPLVLLWDLVYRRDLWIGYSGRNPDAPRWFLQTAWIAGWTAFGVALIELSGRWFDRATGRVVPGRAALRA